MLHRDPRARALVPHLSVCGGQGFCVFCRVLGVSGVVCPAALSSLSLCGSGLTWLVRRSGLGAPVWFPLGSDAH